MLKKYRLSLTKQSKIYLYEDHAFIILFRMLLAMKFVTLFSSSKWIIMKCGTLHHKAFCRRNYCPVHWAGMQWEILIYGIWLLSPVLVVLHVSSQCGSSYELCRLDQLDFGFIIHHWSYASGESSNQSCLSICLDPYLSNHC